MTPRILLASTSPYRAELLKRLAVDFEQAAPDCDETPLPDETPRELVVRLARMKALSLHRKDGGLTIGSDQVADFNGKIIGKPTDHDSAVQQLLSLSGQTVSFCTGMCVLLGDDSRESLVETQVQFRSLSKPQIERYLQLDQPYNCACSFKSESMGSVLVRRMTSDDPSALIGLPLLQLVDDLSEFGVTLPAA